MFRKGDRYEEAYVSEGNGVTGKTVSESSIGAYNGLILFLRLIVHEIIVYDSVDTFSQIRI